MQEHLAGNVRPAALFNWNDLPPARDDEFAQVATIPVIDRNINFGALRAGFDSGVHAHEYE